MALVVSATVDTDLRVNGHHAVVFGVGVDTTQQKEFTLIYEHTVTKIWE